MNQEISNGALLHLLHQSGTLTGILYYISQVHLLVFCTTSVRYTYWYSVLHRSGTLTGVLYGSRMDIHMCTKELTPCLGNFKFSCCNLIKVETKLDKKTQQLTLCAFTKKHSGCLGTNSIFRMCCFNEPN